MMQESFWMANHGRLPNNFQTNLATPDAEPQNGPSNPNSGIYPNKADWLRKKPGLTHSRPWWYSLPGIFYPPHKIAPIVLISTQFQVTLKVGYINHRAMWLKLKI